MANDVLHVVPHGDGWAVKREGNDRPSSTHDTQKNAIEGARGHAKMGDDIVIHRPDGTIRDRITYSGDAINSDEQEQAEKNGRGRNSSKPETHDIWSVGTRVRWSAILAGVVVAISLAVLFTTFATAVGLSIGDRFSGKSIAITAGIVWLVIMLVSLFVGGCVSTRTTTRETKTEALIYGVLVWGATGALVAMGFGSGLGLTMDAAKTASVATADKPFYRDLGWNDEQTKKYEAMTDSSKVKQELNLDEDQSRKYDQAREKSHEASAATKNMSPQQVAWWTLLGLLLSLMASVAGAIVGAGPEVKERTLRQASSPVSTQTVNARITA